MKTLKVGDVVCLNKYNMNNSLLKDVVESLNKSYIILDIKPCECANKECPGQITLNSDIPGFFENQRCFGYDAKFILQLTNKSTQKPDEINIFNII